MTEDDQNTARVAMLRATQIAGSQSELARMLCVKPQSVSYWCTAGYVPLERVFEIEDITGVPWQELRPDLAAMFTWRRAETRMSRARRLAAIREAAGEPETAAA